MNVIRSLNASKYFQLTSGNRLIRDHVTDMVGNTDDAHRFYALRDVTFEVRSGESIAVIGRNGAGKSTLLSIITGLVKPDVGSVEVNGRVAALLELGSGFHADLTGIENLRLNASLLGFTRKETDRLQGEIIDFADIGDFIREPLRTYSSGMMIRLAFAVAVNLDPDILVIDEVLAVGDATFQAKCLDRIRTRRQQGRTMVFVSHSVAMLEEFCDTAVWLEQGRVVRQGSIRAVSAAYLEFCSTGMCAEEPEPQPQLQMNRLRKVRRA